MFIWSPFQWYIFAISVYALILTIRQLFICTDQEWQGKPTPT